MKPFYILLLLALIIFSCSSPQSGETGGAGTTTDNPAAPGFNENSDARAIELADAAMAAMGGRKSWDETRYMFWNFFGVRTLLWDKQTGDVRIEYVNDDLKILLNEKTMVGKLWQEGAEVSNPDSLTKYMKRGRRIWINDSYWLVMPFKLKDSGVTLDYLGKEETLTGEPAEVVRLTFESVGVTPNNAYHVWVSEKDNLVKQWAWYASAQDTAARFTLPWDNYQQMGKILLSEERGDRDLTDVKVLDEVPAGIFEDFSVSL